MTTQDQTALCASKTDEAAEVRTKFHTFKGSATVDFKIVLTERSITELRELYAEKDATPFMKLVNEQHPVNDDAFAEMILRNGVRGIIRDAIIHMLNANGFGGSVSPVQIELLAAPKNHGGETNIVSIDVKRKVGSSPNLAAPYGQAQALASLDAEGWVPEDLAPYSKPQGDSNAR